MHYHRKITEAEEELFLMGRRPDGPVFGLVLDGSGVSHVAAPTFVRGRDHGWFFAFCYRCNMDERFGMDEQTYFNPFTGEFLTRRFSEALLLGIQVREEWMRRRKALRESKRRSTAH